MRDCNSMLVLEKVTMDFVDEFYADKDLSLLKKLTLIIPTYNRNYYLSRGLWYHAHFPFGQIIVADSSPEEKKVVNRETVAKIRERFGANILYLEYEDIETKYGEHISKKWLDAIKHVETEFTHFCADKDFVVPTTVVDDIRCLEENGDYTISSGGYEAITNIDSVSLNAIYISLTYTDHQSCLDDNPCDRLNNSYTPKYKAYVYSTFRTATLYLLADLMHQYSVFDTRYGEAMYTVVPMLYGKYIYRSDNRGHIRDDSMRVSIKGPTKESSSSRFPTIMDYERDPSLKHFYDNFKKCVADTICKVSDLKIDDAEKFVDMNVRKGILAGYKTNYPSSVLSKIGDLSFVHMLWCRTPKAVRRAGNLFTAKLFHHNLSTGDPVVYGDAVYSSDKSPEGIICNLIVKTINLHAYDSPIDILHIFN